jgi:RHO1 GDP-GTP exchange protein 1/2
VQKALSSWTSTSVFYPFFPLASVTQVNPFSFDSRTLPVIEDPRIPIVKRLESCRPMGMFRSKEDEFLLCYDGLFFSEHCRIPMLIWNTEFGLYVDRHGDPTRSATTVEWEGTAERVAFHAPYILIFDSRFIEVRHIETGRLAQIIIGNDIRCIWDGRGAGSNLSHVKSPEGNEIQEAQVHAVMNVQDNNTAGGYSRQPKVIAQNVVELVPTVPLYLPGPAKAPAVPPPPEKDYYQQQSYFSPVSPESNRQNTLMWK